MWRTAAPLCQPSITAPACAGVSRGLTWLALGMNHLIFRSRSALSLRAMARTIDSFRIDVLGFTFARMMPRGVGLRASERGYLQVRLSRS